MILEQITLEGFLSYKKRQTVKFDDDSLIYLVNGIINNDSSLSNGAGKSSLFEAIPVNFFGKIGGRGEKILEWYINDDSESFFIEVIFQIDGTRYKTVRTKGRTSSGTFEIFYDRKDEWQICDKTIEDILGLSHVTYGSTNYFSERETSKFINGTSSERKEILRELLNIKIFETASKKAKDLFDDFEKKMLLNNRLIEERQNELEKKDELEEEKSQLIDEISVLEGQQKIYEANIKKIEKTKNDIETKIEKEKEIQDEILKCQSNIEESTEEKDEIERKISRAKSFIHDENENIENHKSKISSLTIGKEKIDKNIKNLKESISPQTIDLKTLKQKIKDKKTLCDVEKHKSINLELEIENLNKLFKKLVNFESVCPILEEECKIIGGTNKKKLEKEKGIEILKNEQENEKLKKVLKEFEDVIEKLEEQETLALEEIERQAKTSSLIISQQSESQRLEKLIYDFESKKSKAENEVQQTNKEIKENNEKVENFKINIDQFIKTIKELQAKIDKRLSQSLMEIKEKIIELEASKQKTTSNFNNKNERFAVVKNELSRIQQTEKYINDMVEKNKEFIFKKEVYSNLMNIFGKEGIQKIVMKESVPYLEESAQELLKIFDNGSDSLKIKFDLDPKKTSGDLKKGGGLDILIIEDNKEPKDLCMYSGGETVRIVFAILLSLSKLLAKRSGKRQETLIIDEKIAKLDKHGIELFADIINIISSWYKKIFIITHIEALKDVIDNQKEILVSKSKEEGSIVNIL